MMATTITPAANTTRPAGLTFGVCALVFLVGANAVLADAGPPIVMLDAGGKNLAYRLDAMFESALPVKRTYVDGAPRVSIVVPKRFVADVERFRLMDFVAQTERTRGDSQTVVEFPMRQVSAGVAITFFAIAAGLWLSRRRSTLVSALVITFVLLVGGIVGAVLVVTWQPEEAQPANETSQVNNVWPKRTDLGVDVTVVESGNEVVVSIPERLRPPPRELHDKDWYRKKKK